MTAMGGGGVAASSCILARYFLPSNFLGTRSSCRLPPRCLKYTSSGGVSTCAKVMGNLLPLRWYPGLAPQPNFVMTTATFRFFVILPLDACLVSRTIQSVYLDELIRITCCMCGRPPHPLASGIVAVLQDGARVFSNMRLNLRRRASLRVNEDLAEIDGFVPQEVKKVAASTTYEPLLDESSGKVSKSSPHHHLHPTTNAIQERWTS